MFKLDYEQASQRYENIYRAIWQIFQYMAVLSAGILTFGSKFTDLPFVFIVFLALLPLVFWFLATYIPMDRYGEDTRQYLMNLEGNINRVLGKYWQFSQYQGFSLKKSSSVRWTPLWNPAKWWWQVKHVVRISGLILLVIWFSSLIFLLFFGIAEAMNYHFVSNNTKTNIKLQLEPVELTLQQNQIQELKNTLNNLTKDVTSINQKQNTLKEIKNTLNILTQKMDLIESNFLKITIDSAKPPTKTP